MGPKPILGLGIWATLGNGGPSHKGYKMWCLQMPIFLIHELANEIKRIKDKTFCFNEWLGPNLCTRHTSRIHRVRCNSEELRGIRMSEFPPLLLEKRAMIGSLSQNLFFQLQTKGKWLTILESLKKKNKGCSYELTQQTKIHLRLLPQTSPGGTHPLSPSLPILVRLLPQGDLGLYLYLYFYLYLFYNTCIFNSWRICARVRG